MTEDHNNETSWLDSALQEIRNISDHLSRERRQLGDLSARVLQTLGAGNKLIFMGNGGAASEAQHIAAEFVGRMRRDRGPLAAIAITTDTSILTAVSNDWDFSEVFARQVRAICKPGDMVVGLSGSGNSINLVKGLAAAKQVGGTTVACTGVSPNPMCDVADVTLALPTKSTARAQEMHLLVWHTVCEMVDDVLIGPE